MAELALAIIPIGLKICSGLVSYLSGLKDHGDALTRVTRQAESLEGSFRLLDAFLKRGQLEPAYCEAASHIIVCLKSCEEGLEALTDFERSQRAQNRFEHGIQKLCYPLRQAQLEQLESTLNSLCQPLSLAIQNLQLWAIRLKSNPRILSNKSQRNRRSQLQCTDSEYQDDTAGNRHSLKLTHCSHRSGLTHQYNLFTNALTAKLSRHAHPQNSPADQPGHRITPPNSNGRDPAIVPGDRVSSHSTTQHNE
jgi:hypothetical protein